MVGMDPRHEAGGDGLCERTSSTKLVTRPSFCESRVPFHFDNCNGATNCNGAHSPPRSPVTPPRPAPGGPGWRSEEHTSELQPLMRNSYAVFCLKNKTHTTQTNN